MDSERPLVGESEVETASAVDPVCGMEVDPADAAGRVAHHGRDYFFCSQHCVEAFRADPEKYLHAAGSADVAASEHDLQHAQYTCPMHPEVVRDGPGACPKCGMALEPMLPGPAAEEANPELIDMTRRFWAATALAVPVLALAMVPDLLRRANPRARRSANGSSWRWRRRWCCGRDGRSSSADGPRFAPEI